MHVPRLLSLFALCALVACASPQNATSRATPRPTSTPVAPTRANITAAVQMIFTHLTLASLKTLNRPLISQHFGKDTESMRNLEEYVGASDVTPRIDDIRGRSADVSVDYRLTSDNKTVFLFVRRDTLTFVHGHAGWMIDSMHASDKVLRALLLPNGMRDDVTDSRFDPSSGDVSFTDRGISIAWIPQKNGGWRINILSVPTAAPVAQAPPSPTAHAQFVPSSDIPIPSAVSTAAPRYAPVGGGGNEADCEDVDVQGVYGDGEILELGDGRKLRVSDADQAVSAVWVAPFEGMICDGGDKFINKDDNESVDLSP